MINRVHLYFETDVKFRWGSFVIYFPWVIYQSWLERGLVVLCWLTDRLFPSSHPDPHKNAHTPPPPPPPKHTHTQHTRTLTSHLIWQDWILRLQLTLVDLVRHHKEICNAATHVVNYDDHISTTKPIRSQQVAHDALVRVLIDDVSTVNNKDHSSLYDNDAELERLTMERNISWLQ